MHQDLKKSRKHAQWFFDKLHSQYYWLLEDFTLVAISYEFYEKSLCLSYDHFKLDFIFFKVDIISVENAACHGRRYDVTCTSQNVM